MSITIYVAAIVHPSDGGKTYYVGRERNVVRTIEEAYPFRTVEGAAKIDVRHTKIRNLGFVPFGLAHNDFFATAKIVVLRGEVESFTPVSAEESSFKFGVWKRGPDEGWAGKYSGTTRLSRAKLWARRRDALNFANHMNNRSGTSSYEVRKVVLSHLPE